MAVLAQELTNLLVHVTQEVHVRGPAVVALIFHQEVLKDQLQFVFLFHYYELKNNNNTHYEFYIRIIG